MDRSELSVDWLRGSFAFRLAEKIEHVVSQQGLMSVVAGDGQ